MKKNLLFIVAIIAVVFLASGVVYAEVVEGTVKAVDLDGKSIEVNKKDAAGAETAVTVKVTDTTTYTGDATALDEIIEGDSVKLEAEKDAASGGWVAKSAEVTFAEEEEAAGTDEAAEPAADEATGAAPEAPAT